MNNIYTDKVYVLYQNEEEKFRFTKYIESTKIDINYQMVLSVEYEDKDVMELKRLWIEDGYGNNIESYTISKSIKLLKEDEDRAKIIISYSDPAENHKGIIYRASNFYYQGNDIGHSPNYMFKLPNEDKWITARTLTDRIDGSVGIEEVKKKIPDIEIKVAEKKHRYLYFLCNRGEKKRLIKQLKHPLVSYA